jgi:hypothetical protein
VTRVEERHHTGHRTHLEPRIHRDAPTRSPTKETVRPNDSLYRIAERRKVRFVAVENANVALPKVLQPGMKVTIPRDRPQLSLRDFPVNDPQEPGALYSERDLWPAIEAAGRLYGVPPRVIAAMMMQESCDTADGRMRNFTKHHDRTGRGLIGLDPSGELANFELWSKHKLKDGVAHPVRQIEFLALRLSELKKERGSLRAAVGAWNGGATPSATYVADVEARMKKLEHPGASEIS